MSPPSPWAPNSLGLISLGGAVGASVRWGLFEVLPVGDPFWSLLLVNGLGCLIIGWLHGIRTTPPTAHRALSTGFCGGLTTFSTFALEGALLLDEGRFAMMATYITASLLTGIAAVLLGRQLRGVAS